MQAFLASSSAPPIFNHHTYNSSPAAHPFDNDYTSLQQQRQSFASSNDFDITAYTNYLSQSALPRSNAGVGPSLHYDNSPASSNTGLSHPRSQVPPTGNPISRHHSGLAGVAACDWQTQYMQTQSSMGVPAIQQLNKGVKRARSQQQHQRTPSASSTITSNGPASPYMQNGSYPHIVNTDSPSLQAFYPADQAFFSKIPSQNPADSPLGYMPSQAAHMPNAHLAMKTFGINHHNPEDFVPDFAPSRQSMSSYGTDSPATPQSGSGDVEAKPPNNTTQNDYPRNNNVQLFRTESQAYVDELYDPNTIYNSSVQSKSAQAYLSPHAHRNVLGERLQTANLARSASPASGVSRDRSPFRDGSPLAPAIDWKPQNGPVGTAARMRQQQKEQAAQAEVDRASLNREPTKTISPKDALLEYHENDSQPLFQDNIPAGYEKHMGGTEQWPSNDYMSQAGATFGNLSANGHPMMNFNNATSENGYSGAGLAFQNGLPQSNGQVQSYPFQTNYQTAAASKTHFSESTPDFPATIPSMETSHSDAGFPASSQDSNSNGYTSTPQRPQDTRANTGTYTCTYHGCSQRFESHANLQKHKRDYHRSQQQTRESASPSAAGSESPRSTESPAPSGSGMTSAAILARNSQAGPHKCTRINPSTKKPCNTIFSRPYDLTRHEDTIHNNRKQKVRCPMCREEKTFSRNDALTRHMRVVHPEVEAFGKRGRRD